jgi:hypothetical protein
VLRCHEGIGAYVKRVVEVAGEPLNLRLRAHVLRVGATSKEILLSQYRLLRYYHMIFLLLNFLGRTGISGAFRQLSLHY